MKHHAYDLILSNGKIVDGTGADRYTADIGVIGDRIVEIGNLGTADATERLECAGKIIAPGFIDAHTHDDTALVLWPDLPAKTTQGVTTVIIGNCGISLAPSNFPTDPPPPLDLIGDATTYKYRTMAEYLDDIERHPPSVNVAALTGHMSLRVSVMSELDRPARPHELQEMKKLLKESIDAGSIGLSTGLAYKPSIAADFGELVSLLSVVEQTDCLHCTHMRDEADDVIASINEVCRLGREANVPTLISHHKLLGKTNHGRSVETLALIDKMRRQQPLAIDCYPYVASSTVLNHTRASQSSAVMITWSKSFPDAQGRFLKDIAIELGCSEEEAIDRLNPAGAIFFVLSEEDVSRILAWPESMIGSDGIPQDSFPHPRLWGTFPRVLGHYVRDTGLLSLENAVQKMTSLPASVFGLSGRGRIALGAFADIVVFDPDVVLDLATYMDPIQPALGIEHVYVNGHLVASNGSTTTNRPGTVLRRQNLGSPMN